MKGKYLLLLILALFLISGCARTIPSTEAADVMKGLEESVNKFSAELVITPFENLKDKDLNTLSPKEIGKFMFPYNNFEDLDSGDVLVSKGKDTNDDVMILKFKDVTSAGKHMLLIQSRFVDAGYQSSDLFGYPDISSSFYSESQPRIYMLKRDNVLIIIKSNESLKS